LSNAVERMARLGEDPVRSVIDEVPDLATVLQRLSEREA
jgi:hypothetical protein